MMQIMQGFSTFAFEPFEGHLHYLNSLKWTSLVHADILQPYSHLHHGRKLKPLVSKQAAFQTFRAIFGEIIVGYGGCGRAGIEPMIHEWDPVRLRLLWWCRYSCSMSHIMYDTCKCLSLSLYRTITHLFCCIKWPSKTVDFEIVELLSDHVTKTPYVQIFLWEALICYEQL